MSDGIYSALSGAIAEQRSLDVVANNVANANTTGFRGDRVAFQEALARGSGGPAPDSMRFVGVARVRADTSAGPLRQTGNPLDLALQGDGFFALATPRGERYTRAGGFVASASGRLVTAAGLEVVGAPGGDARIQLPPGARQIQVAPNGTVSADGVEVGRVRVVRFDSPDALQKEGQTLWTASGGARPAVDEATQVVQGHLEGANVNAVSGMNELITVSRSFESFQRVIQAFRDLDARTAREVGSR